MLPNATSGPLCCTRATEKYELQICLCCSIPEGNTVRVFEFENRWFRQIKRYVPDAFDPDSHRLDRYLKRVVQNRSIVYNVLKLDDDLVMIQYHNGADGGTGPQVFDDAGN